MGVFFEEREMLVETRFLAIWWGEETGFLWKFFGKNERDW
jgi:hypothetical protein